MILPILLWAALAFGQDAPPWERDFADARQSWQAIPPAAWRVAPPGAARVLEDAQAGRWSVTDDAIALSGHWVRVDESARRERLISLAIAPDGADVTLRCGIWAPPQIKKDSANFAFEDREGPAPSAAPVSVVTRYFRVRAAEVSAPPSWAALPDVAWLMVELDERRPDPFEAAAVRLDPGKGLSGRAVAMALAAIARENFVPLGSPLRDPHLWDVAQDWVDARLGQLPPGPMRELFLTRDERGLLVFKLIERTGRGLASRAAISLPKLQERL